MEKISVKHVGERERSRFSISYRKVLEGDFRITDLKHSQTYSFNQMMYILLALSALSWVLKTNHNWHHKHSVGLQIAVMHRDSQ